MSKYTIKKRGGAATIPISIKLPNINNKIFNDIIDEYAKEPIIDLNDDSITEPIRYHTMMFSGLGGIDKQTIKIIKFCVNRIYLIGNKYSKTEQSETEETIIEPHQNIKDIIKPTSEPKYVTIRNITDIYNENINNESTFINIKPFMFIKNDFLSDEFIQFIWRYILCIYHYNLIEHNNYEDIIFLYLSFYVIKSLSKTPTTKTTWTFGRHNSSQKLLNSTTIIPIIDVLLKSSNGLIKHMIDAFTILTERIHNDLIYEFSPYNIFNKYIESIPKLNNNISIMQICILLYSTAYTPLQNEILTHDLTKNNTFVNIDSLKDILSPSSSNTLKFINDSKIKPYMNHIQSYLLFLYDIIHKQKRPPTKPLIFKYNDFFATNDYTQLAQTIDRIYGLGINFGES
jgi:hypothetical protein